MSHFDNKPDADVRKNVGGHWRQSGTNSVTLQPCPVARRNCEHPGAEERIAAHAARVEADLRRLESGRICRDSQPMQTISRTEVPAAGRSDRPMRGGRGLGSLQRRLYGLLRVSPGTVFTSDDLARLLDLGGDERARHRVCAALRLLGRRGLVNILGRYPYRVTVAPERGVAS